MPTNKEPVPPTEPAPKPSYSEPPPFQPLLDLISDAERGQGPQENKRR